MKLAQKNNIFSIALLSLLAVTPFGWCGSSQTKTPPAKKVEQAVGRGGEKLKEKFHEATDSISQEKIHESIDQVADYFDKDKLKEGVDQLADTLDRDKIKELVDYIADNFDRDKIKGVIDFVADAFDREKIKGAVDEAMASFDKEQVKEKFDQTVDKVAGSLQDLTKSLEDEVLKADPKHISVQEILKKYEWNRYIHDSATYGPATLSHLHLGKAKKPVAVVHPGQAIDGDVVCALNSKDCSPLGLYRIVLGLKNQGGQTTIFNHFGLRAGKETDHFTLLAPQQKGVYEVAFRVVESAREGTALKTWDELNQNGYDHPTTIGLLIVK